LLGNRLIHKAKTAAPFISQRKYVCKNEWSYTSAPPIRLHGVVLS